MALVKFKYIILTMLLINILFTSCQASNKYEEDKQIKTQHNSDNLTDILDSGPVKGKTLTLFCTEPDTLNPVMTKNTHILELSEFIYEGLTKLDVNQKAVPVLADKWEISENNMIWTFYIRKNVFWHDGVSLTAEDVEYTVEYIKSRNDKSNYSNNIQNISAFAAIDRNTFRIVLKKPNSFSAEIMTFPILPKHSFSNNVLDKNAKDMKPVGTGPFMFESFVYGEKISLTENDNWWNRNCNIENNLTLPLISNINYKVYDNINDAMPAFQAGEIDVIYTDTRQFNDYSERSDLTVKEYTSNNYNFLAFNLSKTIFEYREIRLAIAYAIDKSEMIRELSQGRYTLSDIPLSPLAWLNVENNSAYSADKYRAEQILIENGWKMDTPLSFEILVNSENKTRIKAAENICKQLSEIGIKAMINELKWEELLKRVKSKKFDMVLLGCKTVPIPDISFLYSSSYLQYNLNEDIENCFNLAGYCNVKVDEYIEKIFNEVDNQKKKAYFINMVNLINEDMPYIGLFFTNNAIMYHKSLRGNINPYIWNKYNDITQWYIIDE